MSELLVVAALALVAIGAVLWLAFRALAAEREASREIVELARAALAGGRIIEQQAQAEPADGDTRTFSQKKFDEEQARKAELTRINDLYFGDERVPPVVETKQ